MVVTGLRADTRVSGCVIVEGDGVRVASLPLEVLRELGLEVGLDLPPDLEERVLHASSIEAARRVALRLLATRPRAVEDLRRRLRDRGHEPRAIDAAIDRLRSTGLLDDDEFARHYARVRGSRGLGPSRLVHDMMALGVDRRVAEKAIQEVHAAEGVDDAAEARRLAEKRAGSLVSLPPATRRRRLLLYLARRGFRGRDVREMVTEVVGISHS